MILSERGVQMGYVAADRTCLIHRAWSEGKDVRAVFQRRTASGALMRVGIDAEPDLPAPAAAPSDSNADADSGFWPDAEYED